MARLPVSLPTAHWELHSGERRLAEPLPFEPSGAVVRICENPTVVAAAADRLGEGAAPVVCVEGMPDTAAAQILRHLAEKGRRLAFHGDFD